LRKPPQKKPSSRSQEKLLEEQEKKNKLLKKKARERKNSISTFLSNSITSVKRESSIAKREIKIALDKLNKNNLERKRREALAD
jgi:hypothetical protein